MLRLERRSSGPGSGLGAYDAAGSRNGGGEDYRAGEDGSEKCNGVAGIEEGGLVETSGATSLGWRE